MKQRGFSLIELVITITVLTILTLGVLPLVKVSVKRQKEQQLRETLRAIRMAIDEFHRDAGGMVCTGSGIISGGNVPPPHDPRAERDRQQRDEERPATGGLGADQDRVALARPGVTVMHRE